MNFIINRMLLLYGVHKTLGVVDKKTPIPVLNNVLLRAVEDRLSIIATDCSMTIIDEYSADIQRDGAVTIAAKKLHDILKESEGENVYFDLNDSGGVATISTGRSIYKLSVLPAEDFPDVGDIQDISYFKIGGAVLGDMISKTIYAVAQENESKAKLKGALLRTESTDDGQNVYLMVATDGHRLSMASSASDKDCPDLGKKGVIVSRKGLMEIKKLVEDVETVEVGLEGNMLVVKADTAVLKVGLIDDAFPEYQRIIPAENYKDVLSVQKDVFLRALKRMKIISSDRSSSVDITVNANRLRLQSINPEVGEVLEDIDIVYAGNTRTVCANIEYLIDAITVVSTEAVILGFNDVEMKPILIEQAGDKSYLSIVMPIVINVPEVSEPH